MRSNVQNIIVMSAIRCCQKNKGTDLHLSNTDRSATCLSVFQKYNSLVNGDLLIIFILVITKRRWRFESGSGYFEALKKTKTKTKTKVSSHVPRKSVGEIKIQNGRRKKFLEQYEWHALQLNWSILNFPVHDGGLRIDRWFVCNSYRILKL